MPKLVLSVAVALALILTAGTTWASHYGERMEADGLIVQSGMMPSSLLREQAAGSGEGTMHGGIPEGSDYHHFMVALFDKDSGERIEDAEVTATLGQVGLAGKTKSLEPMELHDTVTYGNYFKMGKKGPYRVEVSIKPSGGEEVTVSWTFPGIEGHR